MRLLLNSLRTGKSSFVDAAIPRAAVDHIVIATTRTLVSAGTERMVVSFGKGSLLKKARAQPDKVRQVLNKARSDGLLTTLEAVRSKLDEPVQLGYANVGRVTAVGAGVTGFAVGDRVVSNAPHGEIVRVAKTMAARIPDEVTDDAAAFATLGAIGLQGVRLADPTLGETVVVYGLGLIGLLTTQLLLASGCRVFGIDPNSERCDLARSFGAVAAASTEGDDLVRQVSKFSRGRGADAVIITASTPSHAVIHQAAEMSRKRGRIVLTGVVGLNLVRDDFYKKELSFQVSASYGPGRYDDAYEVGANDYPVGFVRWTQQRNIEAVLDMMACGRLVVGPLISHRFAFDDAPAAYDLLTGDTPSLGILLEYADNAAPADPLATSQSMRQSPQPQGSKIGVFGAGNYASRILIPSFIAAGAEPAVLSAGGGASAAIVGKRFNFDEIATDPARIFENPEIGAVVIATRHDSHADLVTRAIAAQKHVFVEKPLCLTQDELASIEQSWARMVDDGAAPILTVGFNRRFAPATRAVKRALDAIDEPKCFIVTVNAGAIPIDHWAQKDLIGGGRLIGEACHFIDLLRHLAGSPIESIAVTPVIAGRIDQRGDDKVTITMSFKDGSIGTVHYFANGHASVAKERVETFVAGRVYRIDNFRSASAAGDASFKPIRALRPDKGQAECVAAFMDATRSGVPPIPVDELFEVARASIVAAEAARQFQIGDIA